MNDAQFNAVVDRRVEAIRTVLQRKAAEYAYGDRLSNFKRAAAMQAIPPEQAGWNFLVKHIVSLQDMVESRRPYPRAQWDEKLGDAINYLILIDAIATESGAVM